jgi:heat shock protein HslJ
MKKTLLFMIVILALVLTACGGQSATETEAPSEPIAPPAEPTEAPDVEALTTTAWQWEAFTDPTQQVNVDDPENYTLTFQDDGTVNIKADCNNAMGSYTIDGSSITIELGPTTLAACPPDSLSDDFLKYLGFAAIYFFEDESLFIDLMADGGTMQFGPYTGSEGEMPSGATEFDPNTEPLLAIINIGGAEELWLDPTLISMRSGTLHGAGVDATGLGEGCTGIIPPQPDVVFNWEDHEGIDTLRVFFLSMGDPTMLLVTPSGEVLCGDDFNPLVFMGSFEKDAVEPGFLVITGHDQNPATMDLAQLFPRHVDPRAISESIPLDVLDLEGDSAAQPPDGTLSPADLPYQQELTGGGEIGAFNLEQGNHLCTGFISAAPTFRFNWSGDVDSLVMFFESDMDTTLIVRAPDGSFHCDDDYHGSENLNPWLSLTPMDGTYNVWVGSFAPDVLSTGTLTITNDAHAVPTALTSADLK